MNWSLGHSLESTLELTNHEIRWIRWIRWTQRLADGHTLANVPNKQPMNVRD